MLRRYNGLVGQSVRQFGSLFFPGIPITALVGLTANGSQRENTTESLPTQSFHEIGNYQTPAGPRNGPAPNPDPRAHDNAWGRLASDPTVVRALGNRPAIMIPDGWKEQVADQVAVGLADYRANAVGVVRALDRSLRPANEQSQWFFVLGILGYVAGQTGAVNSIRPYQAQLADLPDQAKFGGLIQAVIDDPIPVEMKSARAHRIVRSWQRLLCGKMLSENVQDSVEVVRWFDVPTRQTQAHAENAITAIANRETPQQISLQTTKSTMSTTALVAGSGLFAVAAYFLLKGKR